VGRGELREVVVVKLGGCESVGSFWRRAVVDGGVICSGSRKFGSGVCAMTRVRGVTKVLVQFLLNSSVPPGDGSSSCVDNVDEELVLLLS
jgi:hypothetical protein